MTDLKGKSGKLHVSVKKIHANHEIQQAQQIRYNVFVIGQHVPPEEEIDKFESESFHFLASYDGTTWNAQVLDLPEDSTITWLAYSNELKDEMKDAIQEHGLLSKEAQKASAAYREWTGWMNNNVNNPDKLSNMPFGIGYIAKGFKTVEDYFHSLGKTPPA